MKKMVLIINILFALTILYGQGIDYRPFFAVKIIDNEGSEFLFSDMRYFDRDNELKYFFWVIRGADQGIATYQVDFKKITSIVFTQEYDKPVPGYTAAKMTLSSGEIFDVLINTTGKIGGMDNRFGLYGEILMNYNIIRSIELLHDGEFQKCPFGGAIFYDTTLIKCPFDKTELVPQNFPVAVPPDE